MFQMQIGLDSDIFLMFHVLFENIVFKDYVFKACDFNH